MNRFANWFRGYAVAATFWGLAGFALFFYRAQFIETLKWNAIELIIAQHLLDHGAYVTGLDYPSSIAWRPVVPTLVVTFFRLWTEDPVLIFRWVTGVSLGALAASLYLSGRALWGRVAGHAAALLLLLCPAATTYLIAHVHSFSHLVCLLFLGPAIYVAIVSLQIASRGETLSAVRLAASGLLWGLAYLCRSELIFFAAAQVALLALLCFRHRLRWMPLLAFGVAFLACALPYNLYAGRVAERDGLVIRKTIYGFYASQGWVDPSPNAGNDIEADGYVYAKQLYGDPVENGESLIRAIRHNPKAFLRRVSLNLNSFYHLYAERNFFHPLWTLAAVAVCLAVWTRAFNTGHRVGIVFLAGLFLASHFVLIFHVDPRYLSINLPALILLAVGWIHVGFQLAGQHRVAQSVVLALVVIFCAVSAPPQWEQFQHKPSPAPSMRAMNSLGDHFRATVPAPRLVKNCEPHLGFIPPATSPLYPEDPIILAYFSHSAWLAHGADGAFPRGKLYSFRECEDDYLYVPANQLGPTGPFPTANVISTYENPVLGSYALIQLHP